MGPGRAVTLQDIADRLGVSRSTVSFAVTGNGRVSDEMRRRVLAAARELGYQPNTVARRLRGAQTGIIALHLPRHTTTMSYYMNATFGIVEEANRAGMIVSLLPADASEAGLSRLHADGSIVLDPAADDPTARALLSGSTPIITGEPVPPGLPSGQGEVTSDHARAVSGLLDHLAQRGSRSPALVVPDIPTHWTLSVRGAFESWCAERGWPPRVRRIPHPARPEDVHRAVEQLLDGPEPADAIVAGSDGVVLNVVTGAERQARSIGEDLLVAATVDSGVLEFTRPSITALDLHPREFGRRCVQALLRALDGGEEPVPFIHDVVPIDVRYRASTRGTVANS